LPELLASKRTKALITLVMCRGSVSLYTLPLVLKRSRPPLP
jgi:hypothetical protein